ncbi:hypothetical protein [Nocardioides sp. YIM 152315]|uniref:hypothetical protein n=1 Tax=Nocardioides sp. YIM 152315 TaxID=3031760 RepID=UPI0023DC4FE6|nr:hypothetical protein [Nocardioides sp. YIM 152315]
MPPLDDREHDVLQALLARPGPFVTQDALEAGASYTWLRRWCELGLLCRPVRGVYHSPCLTDDLMLRIGVLRLVVPDECVVTDRTAGWLWGAEMVLAPGDHVVTPAVSVFSPPGHRLRNGLVDSGERRLRPQDVVELDGLRVTVPLRTACDLGRLLHRDQAFAALDSLARLGRFTLDELSLSVQRYRGYRGVVQLRTLVPFVDAGAQSPGESILRLRWLDTGLPRPSCQVPVPSPYGGSYAIDIGTAGERFGAEYDGEEFHGEDRAAHDADRRAWARDEYGWTLVVARRGNVFGRARDIETRLRQAWEGRK